MIDPQSHDKTWPECALHPNGNWCAQRAELMREAGDVIPVNTHFAVPYMPEQNVFATAVLTKELYPAGPWRCELVKRATPGSDIITLEDICLVSPGDGEGRFVIASALRQVLLLDGIVAACGQSIHGFADQIKIDKFDKTQLKINNFLIYTEGACWYCCARIHAEIQASASDGDLLDTRGENKSNWPDAMKKKVPKP